MSQESEIPYTSSCSSGKSSQVKKQPLCPEHGVVMAYSRSKSAWSCREDSCDIVARRNSNVEQPSTTGTIKPSKVTVRSEGDDDEESYVLVVKHPGGSVEIDVTNFTEMSISDPGGDTTLCLLVGVER